VSEVHARAAVPGAFYPSVDLHGHRLGVCQLQVDRDGPDPAGDSRLQHHRRRGVRPHACRQRAPRAAWGTPAQRSGRPGGRAAVGDRQHSVDAGGRAHGQRLVPGLVRRRRPLRRGQPLHSQGLRVQPARGTRGPRAARRGRAGPRSSIPSGGRARGAAPAGPGAGVQRRRRQEQVQEQAAFQEEGSQSPGGRGHLAQGLVPA